MKNRIKINIYGYEWTIEFVNKDNKSLKGCDGMTYLNELTIFIRKDVNKQMIRSILRHELTHAILCVQGRWYQKKFDKEELCEFIAFQTPTIYQLTKQILED